MQKFAINQTWANSLTPTCTLETGCFWKPFGATHDIATQQTQSSFPSPFVPLIIHYIHLLCSVVCPSIQFRFDFPVSSNNVVFLMMTNLCVLFSKEKSTHKYMQGQHAHIMGRAQCDTAEKSHPILNQWILHGCVENPEPGGFRILKMSKLFSLKHKNSNLRAKE